MNNIIYSDDHKYLVKQLKNARKEIGFDQNKVADLLNKTQSYISKIESGQRRIDVIQLKELAKIYKKDINYFLK
jgi:transcriptional regulator with XRE-family HTH domain